MSGMLDKSLEEILKMADNLGIEYEENSENPGFFKVNEDGSEEEIVLGDLFGFGVKFDIDETISDALKSTTSQTTHEVNIKGETFGISTRFLLTNDKHKVA